MSNYKCLATANQVAEDVARRTALTCVVDASGADPVINVGTIGAGSAGALIKVLDQRGGVDAGWDALPGFGAVQQPVYTGTTFQVAFENIDGPALFHLGFANLLQILCDLARRGARVEIWTAAHGNPPDFTTFVSAFDPNPYWPINGRV